ncbi:prephenate dehydratase [Halothermothrix orenii]|uniref:Prephenate dehydratase n=1 Tax=Halothermothrix orenii (strain H 168 / OCM 544 / DSM 9562) TaxID=373903 RepID=B8D0Y3_HALOH|nr:prephenate dehydratase [Halothermothrix orenii]ACL68952.1 Prephenate dehydratase [Halothermothrix orenii H 168]
MCPARYGYLGPGGTFCEKAALKYFGGGHEMISFRTIKEVVRNVKEGSIEKGVIPLENSLEGSVNLSLDLLVKESNIIITGEVIIPINHNLIGQKGLEVGNIKKVLSHPQAIAQTADFIEENLPQAEIIYTESTAAAAECALKNRELAVIGSDQIAHLYGLSVIAEGIQDDDENYTRFIIISRSKGKFFYSTGYNNYQDTKKMYKTSIVCTPEVNKPGVLYEMLGEFAARKINLTRIESRPTRKKLGEYLFYIDLEGHYHDPLVAGALKEVRNMSGLFKILGCYFKDNIKEGSSEKDAKCKKRA